MPRMSGKLRSLDTMSLQEAASAAVTNRLNMSSFAPAGSQARAVNEHKALAEICKVADAGRDEARVAAKAAVTAAGGLIEQRRYKGGIRAGRMRMRHHEVWWMPADVLR